MNASWFLELVENSGTKIFVTGHHFSHADEAPQMNGLSLAFSTNF
jgi:hypothetical protein